VAEYQALAREGLGAAQRISLMEAEFWHERWQKGETGFHQPEYNTHMQAFIEFLALRRAARILVPLCGKSLDMLWLSEQGYRITGIEISEIAVSDFFTENQLEHRITQTGNALLYAADGIEIYCGDFFEIQKADLAEIDAVYDRAALIALPPTMRPGYVRHLTGLLASGTQTLLVSLDYPQHEMKGPPFSVTSREVVALYGGSYSVEQLHAEDCLAREPRFREKGLTRLEENVSLLHKKPGLAADQ
jgi:thiopurine S-methyltransferase